MLKTHGQKTVPIVQEKSLLADTQKTGDQGKHGELVLGLSAHIQGLAVQHLNKILEAWNINFIFNSGSYWH